MNWAFELHIDLHENRIVIICFWKKDTTSTSSFCQAAILLLLFLVVFFCLLRCAEFLKRSHQTNGNRTNTFGKSFKVPNYWLSDTDGTNEWQQRKKHKISIGTNSVCVCICVYCMRVYTKRLILFLSFCLQICISCGVAVV